MNPATHETFTVEAAVLPRLTALIADGRGVSPEAITLEDFAGEWLPEQLVDLLEHAQRTYKVIGAPSLHGVEVRIVGYPDDEGLILALRHEPLFSSHGAQIDGGWDEPSAYIPERADGTGPDVADLVGILTYVVDRANVLLPVLAAATAVDQRSGS